MHRIQFKSNDGNVIICDSLASPVSIEDVWQNAKTERYLCISTEEQTSYDIALEFTDEADPARSGTCDWQSGYFGLAIPSGRLLVTSFEDWHGREQGQEFSVASGEYLVVIQTDDFEYEEYRQQLIKRVGADDVRYSELTNRVGLWAWLLTVVLLLSLFSQTVRENAYLPAIAVATAWLPYFVLTKSSRYRRVEEAEEDYAQANPNQRVLLQRLAEGQSIPGGAVRLP